MNLDRLDKAISSHSLQQEGRGSLRRKIRQRAMLRDGKFPSDEQFEKELQEAIKKLIQE